MINTDAVCFITFTMSPDVYTFSLNILPNKKVLERLVSYPHLHFFSDEIPQKNVMVVYLTKHVCLFNKARAKLLKEIDMKVVPAM